MGSKRKQLLLDTFETARTEHGGELARGKRKTARPISTKQSMHLVFRAKTSRMHFYAKRIQVILEATAKRFGVQVYRYSNNNNHLHLLVRGTHRDGIRNFLRAFAGQVARYAGGWALPVYSRIVEWGIAFQIAADYVVQNLFEARGFIPYRPRGRKRRVAD